MIKYSDRWTKLAKLTQLKLRNWSFLNSNLFFSVNSNFILICSDSTDKENAILNDVDVLEEEADHKNGSSTIDIITPIVAPRSSKFQSPQKNQLMYLGCYRKKNQPGITGTRAVRKLHFSVCSLILAQIQWIVHKPYKNINPLKIRLQVLLSIPFTFILVRQKFIFLLHSREGISLGLTFIVLF